LFPLSLFYDASAKGVIVTKAIELLRQGRNEELWQMCCGFLRLNIDEFMEIQERLLLQQLDLLNKSQLGAKIMKGARPKTLEEFRRLVPLTSYKDYCPELLEKRADILPGKPECWTHSSGRSGEYPCKWVPMTRAYVEQLSLILYGIGMLSCASDWGDTSQIPDKVKLLYSVAPRPYISGTFADILRLQTPLEYLPSLEEAEKLPYEERISLGFKQALSEGIDYFFGLSLVLVKVGEKLLESSGNIDIRPYLKQPHALWRLTKGMIKSRLAGRHILPRDIWSLKGIIGSGIDSWVYKDKIKELWGKNPLDIYSCTEGGVIATQTWDYDGMTFIPNLNFLEFIPEDEQLKYEMDRSYRPATLLLNEVKAGETYELVLTSFHGGAVIRYRVGDVVKITSLKNERLGIAIPQMAFERRVDGVIDFVFVRFTEKLIWQAIENTGIAYNDWLAYRKVGESELQIFIEPKGDYRINEAELSRAIYKDLTKSDEATKTLIPEEYASMMGFKVSIITLAQGTFNRYMAQRQAEGADLAHIKPPHINPPDKIISLLLAEAEETIVVSKPVKKAEDEPEPSKTSVFQ
jgi:hypothetical protein